MRFLAWAARCTPALSAIALLALLAIALGDFQHICQALGVRYSPLGERSTLLVRNVLAVYSILVHLVAFAFPIRAIIACHQLVQKIQDLHARLARDLPFEKTQSNPTHLSQFSDDESEKKAVLFATRRLVVHAIMIPCYKEDIENLKDTLRVLASHRDALSNYDIYLAMEERDPLAIPIAENLISTFRTHFQDLQYTLHPSTIPGEAAGKSSNISWTARHVVLKYRDTVIRNDVLMTVMDSDTHLSNDYFAYVTFMHLSNQSHPDMTFYAPPIIFDRNAHKVPLLVRTIDIMWCSAGISMCGNKPTVTIPISVYTTSLPLVIHVGGWDTGPGAIGEDLHMLLKCYFRTNSKLEIEVVPSAASQCNVISDEEGIRGWMGSHKERYSQGLRHMWGALDTGYALTQWSQTGKNEPELSDDDSSDTCVDSSLATSGTFDFALDTSDLTQNSIKTHYRNLVVFFRLFEAHILPIHLTFILITSMVYTAISPRPAASTFFTMSLNVTAILRLMSYCAMVVYIFFFYDRYHRVCAQAREAEMKQVGLHDGEASGDTFSHRSRNHWGNWADCLVFPIAGIIFGGLPAMHATFSHMFTDKLTYVVSKKPDIRKVSDVLYKEV